MKPYKIVILEDVEAGKTIVVTEPTAQPVRRPVYTVAPPPPDPYGERALREDEPFVICRFAA